MSRQVPHVEDIATGTPTAGLVPVSAGAGLAPAWGAASGSGGLKRCSAIVNHAAFAAGVVTLDLISTQFDSDGWIDLAANTITVSEEGDYLIHSFISWGFPGGTDPTSGTYRELFFTFSGTVQPHFSEQDPPRLLIGGDQQTQDTTTFRHLPAGTVIQVQAQHDATGPMIVSGGSSHPNDITVVKLG